MWNNQLPGVLATGYLYQNADDLSTATQRLKNFGEFMTEEETAKVLEMNEKIKEMIGEMETLAEINFQRNLKA